MRIPGNGDPARSVAQPVSRAFARLDPALQAVQAVACREGSVSRLAGHRLGLLRQGWGGGPGLFQSQGVHEGGPTFL